MGDAEPAPEQDDVSFLRTDDMVCLQSTATGSRICLAAEGFGNRHCFLETIADKNNPPLITSCTFVIEQALSVRALQEMITAEAKAEAEGGGGGGGGGGSKTLLYGHAVLLRHWYSKMYLACLSSTGSSSDKLAFDVGLQENSKGESCWWTVHPGTKQRSEGEKVRVGDEIILVSVATERYLHTAKEGDRSIVDASFKLTHWSVAPFGTGSSRTKNMNFVFGGDVCRFYHGGDECLTIPSNWSDQNNMVIYEGGAVMTQARSLWRLDLIRTKWAGGFINWGYPVRITHITTGRYLGIKEEDNSIILIPREEATVSLTSFCVRADKDDKKIEIDEKEEEVIGVPLCKYGETQIVVQHLETGFWLSYKTYETKKRGVGRVEEKQMIISQEGRMDDWLELSRSQEEEAKTARVIRKCAFVFNHFIFVLDKSMQMRKQKKTSSQQEEEAVPLHASLPTTALLPTEEQDEMVMCLEDLIAYFAQPDEGMDHEERQNQLKALRNRQDLFQEEGILNLVLDSIDKINVVTSQGLLLMLLGQESSNTWDNITSSFYQLLASVIKGNHTNCAEFAQAARLDWLFSRLSSQAAGEGSGMLDVLGCVLTDSPEALNMMKENHIKVIISLLEKHGRDPKVLDVLCSLCVGNGVAVRSSQNNICDNLLPGRNLLLQTKVIDHVASMRPNIYVGKVEGSAMYRRWYFELTIDHVEQLSHLPPQFRVGFANTAGYVPYPGGGPKWGGTGVGDDLFSYGFDGSYLWTSGRSNQVRHVEEGEMMLNKNDVVGCILDLNIPLITFTVNGMPVRGCFKNFNTDGMFYPVVSFSAKFSCRFLFGGDDGRLKYGPPNGHSPLVETLLPGQELKVEPNFQFGELSKSTILGPSLEQTGDVAFVPHPVDVKDISLPSFVEQIRDKLAENIHEVWAMTKIDSGWMWAEVRDDLNYLNPCLTNWDKLPSSEKQYDLNVAMQTLKTILALGYRITMDKPPQRIKNIRLPNDSYLQPNTYKPAPLDLSAIELTPKMEELIELLAENTHNVWASERINQGWTYGVSEDPLCKRSPHLVPYNYVDELIKVTNRDTVTEMVKTLLCYGYIIDPPSGDSSDFDALLGRKKAQALDFRSYRAEKTYAVTGDKWYFETEILSDGPIRVGWATVDYSPSCMLGTDEQSYAYDCHACKKMNSGNMESFGKQVTVGDIVGCLLDLHDRTVSFSLNGELLLDASGNEMAFSDIVESSYVPALTLSSGQKVRLIFGQDINGLKCFTTCGLQEGYQPFCVNMNKNMTFWYNKDEPVFCNIDDCNAPVEVSRIPAGSDSPPSLKITHKLFDTVDKVSWEYLRLSLPVTMKDVLIDEADKGRRMEEMKIRVKKMKAEKETKELDSQVRHPAKLEEHMLQSGFSMADVQDLQRSYSEEGNEMDGAHSPSPSGVSSPWGERQKLLAKAKSLDVPTPGDAQKMTGKDKAVSPPRKGRGKEKAKSQEDLEPQKDKSPFRLFGKKEPDHGKKGRAPIVEPPTVSLMMASASLISPAVPERSSNTLSPPTNGHNTSRRGSNVTPIPTLSEGMVDENTEMLHAASLDLVDEYFVGVRIFPGQDPSHVFCGWVVPNFRHYNKGPYTTEDVRKVSLQVWADDGHLAEFCDRQNSYMLNAGKLYEEVNESADGGRANQGMYVGCMVDASTGTITFTADGKPTKQKFKIEPGTKLFPAVFFEATTSEPLQFELGRTATALPYSSAILESIPKHLTPQCPPRLKVQSLTLYSWARVPNISLKPHALKLSEIRGWSMLVDDPVSMLAVHIPEDDRCLDVLELIENEKLLVFHAQTLALYGALCFQSNYRAAHHISYHVDEKQLMYAIKSEYMSGPLRMGFSDLLISLHLEPFAYSRSLTQNEFIVPLGDDLKQAYGENENLFNSITTLESYSIRPEFIQSEKVEKVEHVKGLFSPYFDVESLKSFVMESLDESVKKLNRPLRDPIGGSYEHLLIPIIKMLDKLLLTGCLNDAELNWLLSLMDPETFAVNTGSTHNLTSIRGILQIHLGEGVKLQMCHLMHHLFDLQLRHRVESLISFSDEFVDTVQSDQLQRYMSVKQEELPAAVAAKKTKEFRCNPIEQMKMMLGFKKVDEELGDICTLSEEARAPLTDFHDKLIGKCKVAESGGGDASSEGGEDSGISSASSTESMHSVGLVGKMKGMLNKLNPMKKSSASEAESSSEPPAEMTVEEKYHNRVITVIGKWAQESMIEDRELVRQMFSLLLRCYNAVGEAMNALETTYVISNYSKEDVKEMFSHLTVVRSLLPVQMSIEEEEIMRDTLWTLAFNHVFFQHPDLIRILRLHENVMEVMTMTLNKRAQGESGSSAPSAPSGEEEGGEGTSAQVGPVEPPAESAIGDTSAMVVACCKFLCYFCRSSRLNQKAMFGQLDFLLENSNILLSRPSLQGSTPLAVAESSVKESPELALALRENYLEKIAVFLSKCGFQSNQDLLDKGYPDLGWDPVEGTQYLGFFKTCVWINGESVEENANLVIRLLIRRPECLGPALRGEGEGLLQAIKDAIAMSDLIDHDRIQAVMRGEPDPREIDPDYVDMGTAILSFYCTLVDVLGRCAPDPATIAQGKNDCIRTRAILRSLVPMADLEGVLSLRFALRTAVECKGKTDLPKNFIPLHKQAMVRFLDRVYGIDSQESFFRLLENAFLPDLRAATVLERHDGSESEMALALSRYIGNFVLPILIKYAHYFGNADNWASLMDATLHTCYRMSKIKILTKGQRDMVSDFLVALTHEMNPSMLLGLLRKLTIDVSVLTEYSTVALRLLTLHYERCGKYYGNSGSVYGNASEEERRLTMLLFTNIFDSLAKMEYDPDLFGKALPCLTAIACALPPDYSLTTGDDGLKLSGPADGPYRPNPVDCGAVNLPQTLQDIVQRFAEHYHDAWAQRKFEHGWVYGEQWAYKKFHPRLMPYGMLTENEKQLYMAPILDALKALLALNWKIDQSDASQVPHKSANRSTNISDFTPQPVDMSSLTLTKEHMAMAEKLAENAHEVWASCTINLLGGQLHPQMVSYDLLTDKEKRKNRERSQELLKFLQYCGFHVHNSNLSDNRGGIKAEEPGTGSTPSQSSTRFASSLLEKLNQYLDTAAISLKLLKPSAVFSRRNSFRSTSRDIKFFSKVVLPLVEKLFVAHRMFFLTAPTSTAAPTAGVATAKEKEMVASLFCKLADLLRSKLSVLTHDAKISVRCLQVLMRATDARTVVRCSPDFVKTVWLTFFNHASDDLSGCVINLQKAEFAKIRGTTMKTSTSLNYVQLVLIPTLTSIFDHLASNSFGFDLIIDDIQVACYKILNSLFTLGTNGNLHSNRKFIKTELEFHRPQIGNCIGAFAASFPVAFLEPALNKSNPLCIHAKAQDLSIEAQSVMQELEASMPNIDDLMGQLEKFVEAETKYSKEPYVIDVLLPMLCAYLPFWYNQSQNPDPAHPGLSGATQVSTDHLNRMQKLIFNLIKNIVGVPSNNWMITLCAHAGMVIINSAERLLPEVVFPLAEKLKNAAERTYHKEDLTRGLIKSGSEESSDLEASLQEDYACLIRDIYAFYPLLIKYVDILRSSWIKNNVVEAEQVYHCIASIFNVWCKSSYMRKEEQNFISGNEIDNMALIMPLTGKPGRPVVTKGEGGTGSVGGKAKKKKRKGPRNKEKELASSLMVSALKRLLPVGLNLFAGREQELVQYAKDKILKKENENDIFEYVKTQLNLPDVIDESDYMAWQHYLYSKLGKKEEEKTGKEVAIPGSTGPPIPASQLKPEDKEKLQELLVERIISMAKVLFGLHVIDHPSTKEKGVIVSVVSISRKRAVIACFRQTAVHKMTRHRAMNIFLKIYNEIWLTEENVGQEMLVESLTQSFEDSEKSKGTEEEGEPGPDPINQLVQTLSRKAMTGGGSPLEEDKLFMEYAYLFSQSCGGAEEEEEGGGEEGEEPSIHEQELEKQKTLFCQMRLVERGVAEMVLLYISSCKGVQSDMVMKTLKLGISILRGGNVSCQQRMIQHLKDKKDVGFFLSVQGLMSSLTVLDLDAFERNQKAEGLGVGAEGAAGEQNMHDESFSCALFRFIQLLCEGHNLDFQDYLRAQEGNTVTINTIINTVDYLLRLQESMMDFYWLYSSKDVIDPSGKENYCKAINVAKQVFSTLTESIQGPCQGNQQALAHSRLWDAVGGFLFLFAHMQDKLSKNSSQQDLLIELLDLQKEMVVMLLSMLEGNVVNGTIARQMVDTLVESAANVELILKFFDMFLKLPDQTTGSAVFKEIDKKSLGWVTVKDFKKALEQQKVYTQEEIDYLMGCIEPTHDGFVDYREFAERFNEPAKEIGFNLAVLLTNLSEHMPNDTRLKRFLEVASSILGYFEPFLGRIEIMGSAAHVERVYFEIKESSISQWMKPQIRESKKAFFYFIVTDGGDKEKLESFVDFCEDAIFEMQHASNIAMEEEEETPKSADYPFAIEDEKPPSILDPVFTILRFLWNKMKKVLVLFAPSNIKNLVKTMKEMTPQELVIAFIKLIGSTIFNTAYLAYSSVRDFIRFIIRLMSGEPIDGIKEEEEEEIAKDLEQMNPFHFPDTMLPGPLPAPLAALEVKEVVGPTAAEMMAAGEADSKTSAKPKEGAPATGDAPPGAPLPGAPAEGEGAQSAEGVPAPATEDKGLEPLPLAIESAPTTDGSTPTTPEGSAPAVVEPVTPTEEKAEEVPQVVMMDEPAEPAEQSKGLIGSINFGLYMEKLICFLARNFYNLKYVALAIAFFINFMLLFYKVTVVEKDEEDGSSEELLDELLEGSASGWGSGFGSGFGSGLGDILSGEGSDEDDESGSGEDSEEEGDPEEYMHIPDNMWYMVHMLRLLSTVHAGMALCLLIGYHKLKLPLVIFKREKEIARRMEFEGIYITEQPEDGFFKGHWDKLAISTPSFPNNYWDKFAKKKIRDKYAEQFGYEQISQLLGMDKGHMEPATGFLSIFTNIDWRYQIWKVGVTLTDSSFQYNMFYLTFSLLGNYNYFFFCVHLLDIAVAIDSLRTILQSVTQNGKELVLTVMLLTITVYIYTVIAFNFFRKFYVSGGDETGEDGEESEPDRKCHNMLNCFLFNVYQGVRAGGGIGDVIEPADGDDYEMYRVLFDITFFFFIIVILLAIIQGLIIDAFGELRSQLQSVVDDMEASCFICGIGKDYFEKVPHGFETHVQKEHNLANYLFFLMHLINKPDTDYTGQETYVWNMYQQRCWDFFPVGECFQKHYETELG